MTYRLRFRSHKDAQRAEQALDEIGGYTALPGWRLAIPEDWLPRAAEVLQRHGIPYRVEEVEPFLGGRSVEEERD